MKKNSIPRPLFDTLTHVVKLHKSFSCLDPNETIETWLRQCLEDSKTRFPLYATTDFHQAINFLYTYRGSQETFNAYRREMERFLQWSWSVHQDSVTKLKRLDIESFIEFCQKPPLSWIGHKTLPRFLAKNGKRIPNKNWRPFIAKISKKAYQDGESPQKKDFKLSQQGMKVLFAVLSSFYSYLLQEEVVSGNPILQIRQKSKFITKNAELPLIRRLSTLQWETVIQTARQMASHAPAQHERTLFIMYALYGMYLRISELCASDRWQPKMNHFFRDNNNHWWFKTIGKGNKSRQIAVSDAMLEALKRWRLHLGLSSLPTVDDQHPLIPKLGSQNPIVSTRAIRFIVQTCFDKAVENLKTSKQTEEAEMLRAATVHWLRHTGISDDVKIRPREHVRDDAGHSSSAITDRYIDIELQARAKSAKDKPLD